MHETEEMRHERARKRLAHGCYAGAQYPAVEVHESLGKLCCETDVKSYTHAVLGRISADESLLCVSMETESRFKPSR